jgi:hypothetical protein
MAALVKPGAGATERQWRAYEEAKALQDYEAKEAQRRAQSAAAPAQPAAVAAPARTLQSARTKPKSTGYFGGSTLEKRLRDSGAM